MVCSRADYCSVYWEKNRKKFFSTSWKKRKRCESGKVREHEGLYSKLVFLNWRKARPIFDFCNWNRKRLSLHVYSLRVFSQLCKHGDEFITKCEISSQSAIWLFHSVIRNLLANRNCNWEYIFQYSFKYVFIAK